MPDISKTSKRKNELSYLNVLFCMLVVFIHVSSYAINALDKTSWQYAAIFFPWRLSAFVVQGFLFLSGLKLFLNHSDGFDYGKIYSSRLMRIVFPYLLWVLIYYIYFVGKNYFPFDVGELVKYVLNGTLVSPFYYVIILVQFYVLIPVSSQTVKKLSPAVVLPVAAVLTLLFLQYFPGILSYFYPESSFEYNDRIFTSYLFYWLAGCYAGAYYDKFVKMMRDKRAVISVFFAVMALTDGALSYTSYTKQYMPSLETVHFLYCTATVMFLFSMALAVADKRKKMSFTVGRIDRASYIIYLTHCLAIFVVNDLMAHFGITGVGKTYLIRFVFVYAVVTTLCILWQAFVSAPVRGLLHKNQGRK